jgi:hypothetical protein
MARKGGLGVFDLLEPPAGKTTRSDTEIPLDLGGALAAGLQ